MTLFTLFLPLAINLVELRSSPREIQLPEPCVLRVDCVLSLLRDDHAQAPHLPLSFLEITRFPIQPCEFCRDCSYPHFAGEQVEAQRGGHSSKGFIASTFSIHDARCSPSAQLQSQNGKVPAFKRISVQCDVKCLVSGFLRVSSGPGRKWVLRDSAKFPNSPQAG